MAVIPKPAEQPETVPAAQPEPAVQTDNVEELKKMLAEKDAKLAETMDRLNETLKNFKEAFEAQPPENGPTEAEKVIEEFISAYKLPTIGGI